MGTTSFAPREQDAILPDASGFVRFYETTFTNVFSKKNDDDDKKESEEEEKQHHSLRFFNRSKHEGWSVCADDAFYVARRFYKTTTVVKYLKDAGGNSQFILPSVNINQNLFETICRDVLLHTRERTVEVYESEPNSRGDFKLTKRGSPGNVLDFEDILFDGSKENDLNNNKLY